MQTRARPGLRRRRRIRGVAAACSAAAVALAALGCASTPRADDEAAALHAPPAPSFRAGPLEPATTAVRSEDLVRAPGSRVRYAVLSGEREGWWIEQRVDPEPAAGTGAFVVAERVRPASGKGLEGAWADSEQLHLMRHADGSTVLREVVTPEEGSRSLFPEGLAFAPPTLGAGQPLQSASAMKVVRIRDGAPRGDGRATRSLAVVGEATIVACGEAMRASVLDLVFEVGLDVATARFEARLYAVPGRGIVAEERKEKVTVLGVFPRSRRETVVLLPEPAAR